MLCETKKASLEQELALIEANLGKQSDEYRKGRAHIFFCNARRLLNFVELVFNILIHYNAPWLFS